MISEQEKKHMLSRGFARSFLLAGALIVLLALAAAGYQGVNTLTNKWQERIIAEKEFRVALKAQELLLEDAREKIEELRTELEGTRKKTSEETTGIIKKLEKEAEKRALTENEREREKDATQKKLLELETDLIQSKQKELTAIIKKWRPRIMHIECQWRFTNGRVVEKTGSGFLFGTTFVATNTHVVEEEDTLPQTCTFVIPDDSSRVVISGDTDTARVVTKKGDFTLIELKNPTARMKELSLGTSSQGAIPLLSCARKASPGDLVVILGYPNIGAENDITATEGIISGYEDPYYITSAKLERGNSGGAAIAVASDCYLGIPTFVRVGGIESLGRILDFAKVYP